MRPDMALGFAQLGLRLQPETALFLPLLGRNFDEDYIPLILLHANKVSGDKAAAAFSQRLVLPERLAGQKILTSPTAFE
jgi:hypothetical protein